MAGGRQAGAAGKKHGRPVTLVLRQSELDCPTIWASAGSAVMIVQVSEQNGAAAQIQGWPGGRLPLPVARRVGDRVNLFLPERPL